VFRLKENLVEPAKAGLALMKANAGLAVGLNQRFNAVPSSLQSKQPQQWIVSQSFPDKLHLFIMGILWVFI
jgi:hypothetical protein